MTSGLKKFEYLESRDIFFQEGAYNPFLDSHLDTNAFISLFVYGHMKYSMRTTAVNITSYRWY